MPLMLIAFLFALASLIHTHLFKILSRFLPSSLSKQNPVKKDKKKGLDDVPGPISVPIFGASWLYSSWGPYDRKLFHKANEDKLVQYGPVVKEGVTFNYPLIHLFDGEDINNVLRHPSDFPLRPPNEADAYYRRYRKEFYLNDGLVNLNGPDWHRLRAQLTPPLTNRNTPKHYAAHMELIAEDFVDLVNRRKGSDGVLQGLKELVYLAGLETVSHVAMEKRMGFLEDQMTEDAKLILDSIRGYQTSSNESMYGLPWYQLVPKLFSSVFTNLVKHKDNLFLTIGKVVDEAMAEDSSLSDEKSILKQLLTNPKVDLKDVKASIVDYVTAGVETIGNSVMFAIALIARDERVRQKLQDELDHFEKTDLTMDTVQKMKYLRACVQESFRLYPTACQIARILEENTVVSGGITLPKGHVVLCHQRVASLQEENFTRAKEFIPERWIDEESKDFANCERSLVLPFGVGKRACPGKRMAELEIYIMVAKLFAKFNVELMEEFNTEFNFLLAPADMTFRVTERKEN